MDNKELRKLRQAMDLTQRAMAEKLGVSLPMYSLYELGKTPMSRPVELLAETLSSKL